MARVLISGASGFVGSGLTPALATAGFDVRVLRRAERQARAWAAALDGVEAVVHLASPTSASAGKAALAGSVEETAALAAASVEAGVKRFVLMSSVKADAPSDAYGRAKREAERAVLTHDALAPIVLRPPLIYAPEAKSSFKWLLRLADTAAPLPFSGIGNRRSLIARDTLAAAVTAVLRKRGGPSGVFAVADSPALSIGDIVALLREGMGRSPGLFPVGPLAALLPASLRESLTVDDGAFRAAYDFSEGDARAGLIACGAAWKVRA